MALSILEMGKLFFGGGEKEGLRSRDSTLVVCLVEFHLYVLLTEQDIYSSRKEVDTRVEG